MTDDRQRKSNWPSMIRNLLVWAFASIVAIALLQFNPLIGLVGAVIGGIGFGIWLFK